MSGANAETYEPEILKSPESRPSEPKIAALLPCSFICLPKIWPLARDLPRQEDDVASSAIFVTSAEKSVSFWLTDCRSTLILLAFRFATHASCQRTRVRRLVVDDEDPLRLQVLADEAGDRGRLDASFGTTRQNVGIEPVVSAVAVAEAETNGIGSAS